MVEFNGYLSDEAEKWFFKKSRDLIQNIFLMVVLMFLPIIILIGSRVKSWLLICGYCSLFIVIPLLVRIPKSQKERYNMTPKRIYTAEEHIVCVANQYTESRLICEVKKIVDHGSFYELIFPFGRVSANFICQKCLLTKGTIEEFESLFAGKIVKL